MIQDDTRKIKAGDAFLAVGKGRSYITPDMTTTCSRIICIPKTHVSCYLTQTWGLNWSKLRVIGVTGTNGKTTVTHLVKQILEANGESCRVLGTINAHLTTPEPYQILATLKEMQDNGERNLVMEVSSIGIVEDRIVGIPFSVKALTNITQDHLDYHKTFKAYSAAKMSFLRLTGPTVFPRDYKKIPIDFPILLQGRFNKSNIQTAYAIAMHLGVSDAIIKKALSTAKPPKGRFELIPSTLPFKVFIDYAHTPDGLDNILRTAKEITAGKLIVVFGAGGNRDTTKRPLMGKVADRWADSIILTSDNPRLEDPTAILASIQAGIQVHTPLVIEDRRQAIQTAIGLAKEGDVIVIAGKGHETYQIIGTETLPFDDTEVATASLQNVPLKLHPE